MSYEWEMTVEEAKALQQKAEELALKEGIDYFTAYQRIVNESNQPEAKETK